MINAQEEDVVAGTSTPQYITKKAKKVIPIPVSVAAHSSLMFDQAEIFKNFVSKVNFAEPTIPVINNVDVQAEVKEDLIKDADFLSIHVQGGERYKDCITLKEMDKMKKTSFIINTSRGPIINEDDLIIALSTNVIAGAGLDVYEKEPLPENNKLRLLPNALLTPHIGYVTAENYSIFYTQMIESLEACVNEKPIRIIK